MAVETRRWEPREHRLVAEWLALNYAHVRTHQRFRVGALHPDQALIGLTPEERRMAGVWRRWVDALVVLADRLLLVEAAIIPSPGDISMLELYERLLPHTPELADVFPRRIQKLLLYSMPDPLVHRLALERGIQIRFYRPQWVLDYLATRYPRQQRAPVTALEGETAPD